MDTTEMNKVAHQLKFLCCSPSCHACPLHKEVRISSGTGYLCVYLSDGLRSVEQVKELLDIAIPLVEKASSDYISYIEKEKRNKNLDLILDYFSKTELM